MADAVRANGRALGVFGQAEYDRMWGPRVTGPTVEEALPAGARKLGLLSDAHGQRAALTQAIGHLRALGAQAFLFNGDALDYWGRCADATGTLRALRDADAICIEGNHDAWNDAGREVTDAALGDWHRSWPFGRRLHGDGAAIVQFHGGPDDIIHYTYSHAYTRREFARMLAEQECQYLIFGHTHMPMCIETERGLVINPGALAYVSPRDGRPSYALLDLDRQACTHYEVYAREEAPPLLRRRAIW